MSFFLSTERERESACTFHAIVERESSKNKMMTTIESSISVRFRAGAGFSSSPAVPHYRRLWCSNDVASVNVTSCRLSHSGSFDTPWSRFPGKNNGPFTMRNNLIKYQIRASGEQLGSGSERNEKPLYHPSEEIGESALLESGDARLTAAETTRTIVEVNSKATLMFTGMVDDEVHHNIFWPELPYVTDEYGNIYFQVNNDEDVMQSLTSEDNFVQVIVGFDTLEMIKEMELSNPSEIDFGFDDFEDEDSDFDDEDDDDDDEDNDDGEDEKYEKDWVAIMEDDEDEDDSDETIGDWAKLDTMRSSHPMYFAKKLAEVVSDNPIDCMDQPPAGIAIQGLLRPAFIEEHSVIRKHISEHQSSNVADVNGAGNIVEGEDQRIINGHGHEPGSPKDGKIWAEELEKDESLKSGTSFYKLEMVKVQLISAHGHQTVVDVEDFGRARPDAIAHSAAKIISRLKAGGEKTTQALKSLCWRCKNIQVEEATLIGIDSLGFDLRVCSGTQIQTLRFAYNTRATSEYSAERQLNDLLFPRIHHKLQKMKQVHQKEC